MNYDAFTDYEIRPETKGVLAPCTILNKSNLILKMKKIDRKWKLDNETERITEYSRTYRHYKEY